MDEFEGGKVAWWNGRILVPTFCSSNRGQIVSQAPFTSIKINVLKGIFVFECFWFTYYLEKQSYYWQYVSLTEIWLYKSTSKESVLLLFKKFYPSYGLVRNRWPWWLLRMALSVTVVLQLWVQWQHRKLLCLKISPQNTALQPVHIEMITWKLRHLNSFSCWLQSFKEIWEQRSRQHILIKSICAHQYLSHIPLPLSAASSIQDTTNTLSMARTESYREETIFFAFPLHVVLVCLNVISFTWKIK